MEFLGSAKSKKTKNENSKNVPNLDINEVVLVHCNVVNINYKKNQESCTHLCQISHLVN